MLTPAAPTVGNSKLLGFFRNTLSGVPGRIELSQWTLPIAFPSDQASYQGGWVELEFETSLNELYLLDCTIYRPKGHEFSVWARVDNNPVVDVEVATKQPLTLGLVSTTNPIEIVLHPHKEFWGLGGPPNDEKVFAFEGCTLHAVQ